jgi:ATP-binding cassette subfamily B multidrug efflux pump
VFKFFENLVNPYGPYEERDKPPTRLGPFMMEYARPFRRVFMITAAMSVVVAAIEVWLIYYMGRVVDLLGQGPAGFLENHGLELVAVGVFILVLRPLLQGLDVLLLNKAVYPKFCTLIRGRAHKQV